MLHKNQFHVTKDLNVTIKATKNFQEKKNKKQNTSMTWRQKRIFSNKIKKCKVERKRLIHGASLKLKQHIYQKQHNKSEYITHKL